MNPEVALLSELGREHRAAIRDQTALTNMMKARARDYVRREVAGDGEGFDPAKLKAAYKRLLVDREDPLFIERVSRILEPCDALSADQARLAKEMGRVAERLAVWEGFARDVRGVGAPMLGKLVAEAPGNNLDGFPDYRGPACLWKRFGLHVVDGAAARPRAGVQLDYSPYRRSVAWQMGDSLLRAQLRKGGVSLGEYGALYLERKAREVARAGELGLEVRPAAKIRKGDAAVSEGVVHARAKRFVEKRVIRDLWRAWRGE